MFPSDRKGLASGEHCRIAIRNGSIRSYALKVRCLLACYKCDRDSLKFRAWKDCGHDTTAGQFCADGAVVWVRIDFRGGCFDFVDEDMDLIIVRRSFHSERGGVPGFSAWALLPCG